MLSGTTPDGIHHAGVLEGWFGAHWWNGRFAVLLITTLAIFAPLASLKRIGESFLIQPINKLEIGTQYNVLYIY